MRRMGFLACVLGLMVAESAGAADPRLEKVLADWQKRQHKFDAVEYRVVGVLKVPKGAYTNLNKGMEGMFPGLASTGKTNPPQDVEGPVNYTFLLDLVKGRYRRERLDQSFLLKEGKLQPGRIKDAFNGTQVKSFHPNEEIAGKKDLGVGNPEYYIASGNMKGSKFLSTYYPIFFGHGRLGTDREPIIPGQFRNNPNLDELYVHDTGVLDERKCLVVRTKPLQMGIGASFAEYWVDTERDSAIVRYLSFGGKHPSQEIRIHYRLSHDSWLPQDWHWTVFERGQMLYYQDMRVEKVTVNPPIADEDFEVGEIKPGMLVEERKILPTTSPTEFAKSEVIVYREGENGKREEIPDPFHRPGDQYPLLHHKQRQMSFYLLLVVPAVVLVLFWSWKRTRKFLKRAK